MRKSKYSVNSTHRNGLKVSVPFESMDKARNQYDNSVKNKHITQVEFKEGHKTIAKWP